MIPHWGKTPIWREYYFSDLCDNQTQLDMKKVLIILAAMLTAFCAQAKNDIEYYWIGDLPDDAGQIKITAARRTTDNLLIGQLYWDEITYDIAGWQDPTDPDRIGFMMFRSGYNEGSVMASIDEEGNLEGRIKIGYFSSKMYLTGHAADAGYPDQFSHPSFKDMSRFTCYSATMAEVQEDMNDLYTPSVVIEKDGAGKFAFKHIRYELEDGLSSLDLLIDGTEINDSYEYVDGVFTYENPPHYVEFEVFNKFLVVHYANEEGLEEGVSNRYSRADGIYAYKASFDEYENAFFHPYFYGFYADGDGENDDEGDFLGDEESDYVVGDAAWGVRQDYEDVLELSLLINTSRIYQKKFPVDLAQASRPNIDLYFRSLAYEFKDFKGLFKNALPKAQPDMKNGYLNVSVPGKVGGEGIEMCYWRGAEGKDVVALKLSFDEFDVNEEWGDRLAWTLYFFQYNPSDNTLSFLSRWSRRGTCDYVSDEYDSPFSLEDVEDVKLPQVGKTIKFLDFQGNTINSCEWNADYQWFVRN